MRRCSISARAIGLLNGRSGRRNSNGALWPFVAGLVARGQYHRHVDAGPGMLGQILRGLPDAIAGARLRQHQREVGRARRAAAPAWPLVPSLASA